MSSREISKGENTRRRIIRAALGLAARHGFAETSFQMIADELKLSQSAVMYHFASKNELVEELIKTIISHNHDTVAGLMKPEDDAPAGGFSNIAWGTCFGSSITGRTRGRYSYCFTIFRRGKRIFPNFWKR